MRAHWQDRNTGNFVRQANACAESLAEAGINVSDCWFDANLFDAELEFAVRSRALQSGATQAEVGDADAQRLAALAGLYRRFGCDDFSADVRSRTIYLVQIGTISMQTVETLSPRMERTVKYVEIFTDIFPHRRDLGRFFARYAYTR